MTALRTTAILKTDLRGSTLRFRGLPEADLDAVLRDHRAFVTRLAAAHDGQVVKPEGDGFWVVFPSVTAAALAAMAMQEELRLAQPGKGDDRLAMRIVISLGDVLHQEGALIGDAVVLAARIEALTPSDEIYLSAAACLTVNQGEVRTGFVDAFPLKGFAEPVPVYRIEQTHRTHVITDQYIVMTDLRGFDPFTQSSPMTKVEKVLNQLVDLVGHVCLEFSGTNRMEMGDAYCMTFLDPDQAMAAVEHLSQEWKTFVRQEGLSCHMNLAVHKGTLYAFRSFLYGSDMSITDQVGRATRGVSPSENPIFVTGKVRGDLMGTHWEKRLQSIDIGPTFPRLAEIEIYRLL